jgi:DNA (cytosine-5)-methyltransferase 1
MMMLPEGHVTNPAIWEGMTDKRGKVLTGDGLKSAARNAELKALGNGVVPPQCAATGRMWLADMAAERGAA